MYTIHCTLYIAEPDTARSPPPPPPLPLQRSHRSRDPEVPKTSLSEYLYVLISSSSEGAHNALLPSAGEWGMGMVWRYKCAHQMGTNVANIFNIFNTQHTIKCAYHAFFKIHPSDKHVY